MPQQRDTGARVREAAGLLVSAVVGGALLAASLSRSIVAAPRLAAAEDPEERERDDAFCRDNPASIWCWAPFLAPAEPVCDCSWKAERACPLALDAIDMDHDSHVTRHEALDLDANGVVTQSEAVALDENHDGHATKLEALDARAGHPGTAGFAIDDGSDCFIFCCRTPSPPPLPRPPPLPPPPSPSPPPPPPPPPLPPPPPPDVGAAPGAFSVFVTSKKNSV